MSVVQFDIKRRREKPDDLAIFMFRAKQHGIEMLYDQCCVCNWSKTNLAYGFLDPNKYDFDSIVPLCPNHHAEFHSMTLTESELSHIQEFMWNVGAFLGKFEP